MVAKEPREQRSCAIPRGSQWVSEQDILPTPMPSTFVLPRKWLLGVGDHRQLTRTPSRSASWLGRPDANEGEGYRKGHTEHATEPIHEYAERLTEWYAQQKTLQEISLSLMLQDIHLTLGCMRSSCMSMRHFKVSISCTRCR